MGLAVLLSGAPAAASAQGVPLTRLGIASAAAERPAHTATAPFARAATGDHRVTGALVGAGVFIASLLYVVQASDGEAHAPDRPLALVAIGLGCTGAGALIGSLFPKRP